MLAGHTLDPADQLTDIERRNHAQHAANDGADNTDHRALDHEDRHDLPGRSADGAQDRDVGALVVHHHDQRRNDVERRHRDDHQQQQADHGFFHLHRAEQAALGVSPVVSLEVSAEATGNVRRHLRRSVQILDCQPHALHLIRLPVLHGRGVGDMNQAHRTVQLGADLEHANHIQALHARGDTARRGADFRDDQSDLVADIEAETPRGDFTDHHTEFARLQGIEATLDDVLGNDRHLAFLGRINAADLNRLHRTLVGQHAFHLGERHGGRHFGIFHRGGGHWLPVIDRLDANDGGMGHHAEDARAHLALEAIHHRQHHDHRQHAEGEADHRGHRNERNKAIAALGAGIARADKDR